MMWRASLASSRDVTRWSGSGRPVELVKFDCVSPSSRARSFISTAKLFSLPEMPSASAMQRVIGGLDDHALQQILDLHPAVDRREHGRRRADGAPPRRQASSLMMNSSSSLSRPCLISLNTISAVISLARLDGAVSVSAPFSNSTVPVSASIRIACGAAVWNSSFFAPETGIAAPHGRHQQRRQRDHGGAGDNDSGADG